MDRRVAILSLDAPSPAGWTGKDGARFLKTLQQALGRPSTQVVILTGSRLFKDEQVGIRDGALDRILNEIAAHPTPVIAAIPGDATGQGLELALACHARVAARTSNFALPDIAAARLPTAQTLERLARLVSVDMAVSMVALGERLGASAAKAVGLIDALAQGDPVDEAARLALDLTCSNPVVDRDPVRIQAEFLGARIRLRRLAPGQTTAMFVIRALEAAALAPHRRVRGEIDRISLELAASDQAIALRYAYEGASQHRALTDRGDLDPMALARTLRWPMLREAIHLIDAGATPAAVDRCLEAYGFPEGPFAESDRLGLEAVFARGSFPEEDAWIGYSSTLDLMVDCGRRGGPSAPGWLSNVHAVGHHCAFPDVESILRSSAISQRRHRGGFGDDVIIDRCLYAAINASAKLLQFDLALNACVVDAIWTTQLGFPKWKGGPLYQAQKLGWSKVVQTIADMNTAWGTAGPPCEVLIRAASTGCLDPRSRQRVLDQPFRNVARG
jgi:enoyl-CoA hydratase/carnithine racemase